MWDEDLGARRAVPSFFPFYFLFYFFISFGFIYGALILPFFCSTLTAHRPPFRFLHGWALMIDSEVVHRTTWVRRLLTRWDRMATRLLKVNLCLFRAGDACRAHRLSLAAY